MGDVYVDGDWFVWLVSAFSLLASYNIVGNMGLGLT